MRMYDIIKKKRDKLELNTDEINFFINEYTSGNIPDYQASALLMAIYFNGMTKKETADLTMAMIDSGSKIDLSSIDGIKVDKHSTGGVGDKTSLVLAPLVASCGVPVAKMSGRGLGHTGGTIDKLESIDGFKVQLSMSEFIENVKNYGISIMGQTANIATADKKLYSLRDVTATVDNISLIASSIMSKKLASGADAIVLDVKSGSGAFMKDIKDSIKLANEMVQIGQNLDKSVIALITNMDEPLGYAIGNSLEVKEAAMTLLGQGPIDLTDLCIELGAIMVFLGKASDSIEKARELVKENLNNGSAYKKFIQFIQIQGGNIEQIQNLDLLLSSKNIIEVKSKQSGFISHINAEEVGKAALFAGAGRETKESPIDYSAGIVLKKKIGDYINSGETIAVLHTNIDKNISICEKTLLNSFEFSDSKTNTNKLIYGIVDKDGFREYIAI